MSGDGAPTLRVDGYAAIGDYGAIGDGRATALVARDGSIDWLCWPAHDSGSIFGALLDPERGGAFQLEPSTPTFQSEQRYLDDTNVLQTTFRTDRGVMRVTDAVTNDGGRLLPWHELVRRVECLDGEVAARWGVRPRPGYGTASVQIDRQGENFAQCSSASGQLGVLAWGPGTMLQAENDVSGKLDLTQGDTATLGLVYAPAGEPLPVPERDELESRLDRTAAAWREWLSAHDYEGPWRAAVERSLLALRLLTARSGAVVAAATTSLPERLGGDRNFDYRHAWPRDTSFMLNALLHCGLREPAHGTFAWLLQALEDTHPRVQPIYRLSGEVLDHQIELPLRGYRDSRPVVDGNDAAGQLQLGAYGDLVHTAWLYTRLGNRLDPRTQTHLAENVELLGEIWQNEDSGIWELPERRHYTSSKMGCWLAFDRALRLAEAGQLRDAGRLAGWRARREDVARWVEAHCWSGDRGSYTQHPETDGLDVACLLMGRMGYASVAGERFQATLGAIGSELMSGPYTYRYSGMQGREGAFVACSFWIAESLARIGRLDEAGELMDAATGIGNGLGLLSEEADPATGELLGNYPQALSHLALINAAATIQEAAEEDGEGGADG